LDDGVSIVDIAQNTFFE